ncbi:MAG: tRNA 4-thiouridine(8) synthase ThiI [Armatimonadetes bacterium]|nr:tRNA 4-thiouridine(8) synthase ThiI [Armatimonadota bacterium]MCX7967217.1 tRNA 4-thiouridine(8) synthase ThiI [Armatimonadota bacterium]MDW8143250.1 tRNA uracil 4-sulfurtransferase ThiI [Armatimonadota bacterium]
MLVQEQVHLSELDKWLKLSWDGFVVHYHEIGLKGGNRRAFTKVLCRNLKNSLKRFNAQVQDLFDRLFVTVPSANFVDAIFAAAQVFGVAYVAPVRILPRSVDAMVESAVQTYNALASEKESFAVRVRRIDKSFPLTSQELERLVGQRVVDATGAPVNLSNPSILLSLRLYRDCVYQVGPKIQGVGGLPVGVTGKVLSLLSGGIDSPVAAWLVMKRGCSVDFVHFHAMPNNEEAAAGKVPKLVEKIITPQGISARLFLVPYHTFQLALLMSKVQPPFELVLFRRFMVKVANRIAKENGHQAIVTGDNLSQVASQTLENLTVVDNASDLSIFRPLLTYDKQEIVALAQRIGTYELSIQPYKDCCSLIARHPETKANLHEVLEAEKILTIEQLVERSINEMMVLTVGDREL